MTKNFPPKKRKAGNWWNDKKRNLWKPFLIGPCPIKGLADTFMMWGRTDSNLEVCTIGETTGPKASIAGKMYVMIFPTEDFSLNLEDFIPSIISGNIWIRFFFPNFWWKYCNSFKGATMIWRIENSAVKGPGITPAGTTSWPILCLWSAQCPLAF